MSLSRPRITSTVTRYFQICINLGSEKAAIYADTAPPETNWPGMSSISDGKSFASTGPTNEQQPNDGFGMECDVNACILCMHV